MAGVPLALGAHPIIVHVQVQAIAGADALPQIPVRLAGVIRIARFRFGHAVGQLGILQGRFRRRHGRQLVHLAGG